MNLVSVIIPAYNAEGYIRNCIQSILNQTYRNFEIVVVNDGSSDHTAEILKQMAIENDCIRVITQPNSGVSAARNAAIDCAKGDFLTMVDADDDLPTTALEDMVALMTNDVDFVIGSHYEVKLRRKESLKKPAYFKHEEIENRFREFDPMIWFPWAKMFRHSVIVENHIRYDTNITYGEDHVFNLAFVKAMKGAAISTNKVVYNYYYIRGGLCAKYYPNMDELQRYVLDKLMGFFGGINCFPRDYKTHYVGCYLTGCMDYYIAWCNQNEAINKVKESFQVYSDLVDEQVLNEFFDDHQRQAIAAGNYQELVRDYTFKNPRKTLWRKMKRKVRIVLEYFQGKLIKKCGTKKK